MHTEWNRLARHAVITIAGVLLLTGSIPAHEAQQAPPPPPAAPPAPAGQQEPPAPPPAPPPAGRGQVAPPYAAPRAAADRRNVTILVAITEKGAGQAATKRLTLVAAEDSTGKVRSGLQVPVPHAAHGAGGAATSPVQITYRDVGLNIDAQPRLVTASRIDLRLTIELSGLLPRDPASEQRAASFRNVRSELQLMLDSGKPVEITQALDSTSNAEYSIQVTATVQK